MYTRPLYLISPLAVFNEFVSSSTFTSFLPKSTIVPLSLSLSLLSNSSQTYVDERVFHRNSIEMEIGKESFRSTPITIDSDRSRSGTSAITEPNGWPIGERVERSVWQKLNRWEPPRFLWPLVSPSFSLLHPPVFPLWLLRSPSRRAFRAFVAFDIQKACLPLG